MTLEPLSLTTIWNYTTLKPIEVIDIMLTQLDHHMELHYSQTYIVRCQFYNMLDHHMELHYSQTM